MNAKQAMAALNQKLAECQQIIVVSEWTKTQLSDQKLGEHMMALEQHLEKARGRAATVAQVARECEYWAARNRAADAKLAAGVAIVKAGF